MGNAPQACSEKNMEKLKVFLQEGVIRLSEARS